MDERTMGTGALLGRAAFGVAAWFAPDASFKAFGVPPGERRHYITRLFAVRDLALGAAGLLLQGDARRTVMRTLVVADAIDCVAGAWAWKKGEVGPVAAAMLVAGGLAIMAAELPEATAVTA